MLVQQVVIDDGIVEGKDSLHRFTPTISQLSRSDCEFPLSVTRKRAPSITSMTNLSGQDGHTVGHLTIRARDRSPASEGVSASGQEDQDMDDTSQSDNTPISILDLPLEVLSKVLDYIFGEVHSVNAASTSLRGLSVSHSMRHPRRKAVSDLALVCEPFRELVQERIYRHIKIKGTQAGLAESEEYFTNHDHLTEYVRHIEFWVPVWGDKAGTADQIGMMQMMDHLPIAYGDENMLTAHSLLGFNFELSIYSATLDQIFKHTRWYFPRACIFTLEGGHCKRSNMIRHFANVLFPPQVKRRLEPLPNIRTFAMRGAWNIMRNYEHWSTIEQALPNVEEWHCGYAKPREEAYTTINEILLRMPMQLRHVNISLDGMYSKDDSTLGSNSLLSGMHLCEQLGRVTPHVESLSYTGKICECFWTAANEEAMRSKSVRLQSLEIVVKSCCRQRVSNFHQETGKTVVEEIGGIMADVGGITNLVFIKAFERLVLGTVDALAMFTLLNEIRIRYIDLDSPCALLNPYWHLAGSKVYGVWNEEIVERLHEIQPGTSYAELTDGLGSDSGEVDVKKEDDAFEWRSPSSVTGLGSTTMGSTLYPKRKPMSIKTSSYRMIAEARGVP